MAVDPHPQLLQVAHHRTHMAVDPQQLQVAHHQTHMAVVAHQQLQAVQHLNLPTHMVDELTPSETIR